MSVKISNLDSITSADLIAATSSVVPVVANPAGPLTTYKTSLANIKTFVGTGNLNVTGNITVAADSTFGSNLTVLGNLVITGNTITIGSNNLATTDNIFELHVANAANVSQPWTVDDGKDIGIRFHYYTSSNQDAALVLANDTKYLEWYNSGAEGNAKFTGTSYGTMKMGGLVLANTTATTANATGALQVSGGTSIGGNLWVVGGINGQGYISTSGTGTFSGVQSNGAANVGSTLTVTSSATVNSLTANTTATVGSTLVVGANATINNLTVNASGVFTTTLQAKGGLQNTPIGNATPTTALFTTVGASGNTTVSALTVNASATIGTTLGVTGNVTAGNLTTNGALSVTGNANVGNLITTTAIITTGSITTINSGLLQNGTSNIAITANGNITMTAEGGTPELVITSTGVNVAGTLSVSGNTTVGNASTSGNITAGYYFGNGSLLTGVVATSVGTLATLTVTGVSNLNGNVNTNNIMPFGNANANIGSTALQFNTIFAKATSAQYADLAENYISDAVYEPGTVVIFGGTQEITVTNSYADTRVAGVISTDPAYLMNSGCEGLPVALRGRVPVKVIGQVGKGDLLVTSEMPGYAVSVGFSTNYNPAAVVAKSIEDCRLFEPRLITAVIV